jgi:hypothetical protein
MVQNLLGRIVGRNQTSRKCAWIGESLMRHGGEFIHLLNFCGSGAMFRPYAIIFEFDERI